ncbi:MAG: MBL fold metallo-hydrolase [Pseudomonadota bacterium]
MALQTGKNYFIAKPDVVLRKSASGRTAVNHLILGDWLRYLGESSGDRIKVRCRGDVGWLHQDDVTPDRALEVNFVDIGQGDGCHIVTPDDDIMLIDAGVGSNMERFLSWRYNLRGRNVARAPDFDPTEADRGPWKIDYVVVSHPDNDHYLGFRPVFENPKLSFEKVFHNGIVERPIPDQDKDPTLTYPSGDDLGGYVDGSPKFLWDVAFEDARLKEIVADHPSTTKQLLSTYRACLANSPNADFKALGLTKDDLRNGTPKFMDRFDGSAGQPFAMQVLGPVTETVTHAGETRQCLRKLGSEGVTKNGHSVTLRLKYGRLRVMLGGDLNTQAQDFLLKLYAKGPAKTSSLEKKINKLTAKGHTKTAAQEEDLETAKKKLAKVIANGRKIFECDVAKACHHGSSHITDAFVSVVNAIVTVISSGDEESHSHPRPDALGTYGKHGRGLRPLIFSTELARSTREFTPIIRHLDALRQFEARIEAETNPAERRKIQREMENKKDRNVAVYGMITMRALGDKVVLAQKLEVPRNEGAKWDLYELEFNHNTDEYEYHSH